jgi:hypothetical protein
LGDNKNIVNQSGKIFCRLVGALTPPDCSALPCPEFRQVAALDQPIKIFQSENLATGGQQQLFHVFAADFETAASDAGNDFETR